MSTNSKDLPLFGFLNIYKPAGMTSHDVVACLRRVTKIKQIGHTGTLDPFATGVLPVCIGKATRLIEYLDDDKEYIATVQFGAETDTYDCDGQITEDYSKHVSIEEIQAALKNFEGEIEQYPPIYSAIKVNGKKLYEYARQGENVEIKPRLVTISKIKLLNFDEEQQIAQIVIACSKGTYIRSIAHDLGKKLECGGYLVALERTKAGHFTVENTIKLDTLNEKSDVYNKLINPLDVLSMPVYTLNEKEKERVSHGMPLKFEEDKNLHIVILVYSGKIYAIGSIKDNQILVKKVFEVL